MKVTAIRFKTESGEEIEISRSDSIEFLIYGNVAIFTMTPQELEEMYQLIREFFYDRDNGGESGTDFENPILVEV